MALGYLFVQVVLARGPLSRRTIRRASKLKENCGLVVGSPSDWCLPCISHTISFFWMIYTICKSKEGKKLCFLEGGGCKSFMKSWNAWIIDSHSNAGTDVCLYFLVTIFFSITSGCKCAAVGCFCIWVCWVWHRGNNFTIIVVVTSGSYRYGCLSKSYEQESHPFWECLLVGLDCQKCGSRTAW